MRNRRGIQALLIAVCIAWTPAAPAGWTHGGDASASLVRQLIFGLEHLLGIRTADRSAHQPSTPAASKERQAPAKD